MNEFVGDLAVASPLAAPHHVAAVADAVPLAPAGLSPADRAVLYDWLAAVFADAPTRAAVAALRCGPAAAFLAAPDADPALAPGLAVIAETIAAEPDDDALTARLGIAFGRLFLGIGGPETVSPYESAHRCGRLFQEPTAEMERLLARHDLSVAARGDAADHVSIELALLARLVATGDADRAALAARLALWVPAFCDLCVDLDDTGWFAGAAAVLAALVAREADLRDENPTEA